MKRLFIQASVRPVRPERDKLSLRRILPPTALRSLIPEPRPGRVGPEPLGIGVVADAARVPGHERGLDSRIQIENPHGVQGLGTRRQADDDEAAGDLDREQDADERVIPCRVDRMSLLDREHSSVTGCCDRTARPPRTLVS